MVQLSIEKFVLIDLLNDCLFFQLFFNYYAISACFHFYHMNTLLITINNFNKNFNNLNSHLNFRHCIYCIVIYNMSLQSLYMRRVLYDVDMYRLDPKSDEVTAVSIKIPVHPISFKEAKEIVEKAFAARLEVPDDRKRIHLTIGQEPYQLSLITKEALTLNHEVHNVLITIPGTVEAGTVCALEHLTHFNCVLC